MRAAGRSSAWLSMSPLNVSSRIGVAPSESRFAAIQTTASKSIGIILRPQRYEATRSLADWSSAVITLLLALRRKDSKVVPARGLVCAATHTVEQESTSSPWFAFGHRTFVRVA